MFFSLTSVGLLKVFCPVRSWITFMATGSLTVSPSGIQMPCEIRNKNIDSTIIKCARSGVSRQPALPCRQIQTLRYPAASPSGAQRASGCERGPWRPSLRGPEAQRSEGRQRYSQNQSGTRRRGHQTPADLSTFHVSPHSPLAPNGQTSAVQQGQHENGE